MALYHVHAATIAKGRTVGGATGFSQYIGREHAEKATQQARYVQRDGWSEDDLVAKGSGSLPPWAKDGTHFFLMADHYERQGGVVARTYEIALPRELAPELRLELAADIRSTFFERYPHTFAMHNPIDPQGEEHPHMHLMLSERRQVDSYARGPQQYFARAAAAGQDPATHGVLKDRSWQGAARLHELRAGIATLTNAALERAGVQVAVSHRSLVAQGIERDPLVYKNGDKAAVEAQRVALAATRKFEALEPLVQWHGQKVREHITDISREAMVDRVRDRFWLHDVSPAREQERQESAWRTIHREHQRTGRPLQGQRVVAPRAPRGELVARLAALTARLTRLREEQATGAALNVRLYGRERESGMGF